VVGRFRRTGYHLLGSRFDYLLHTRPIEWPILAAHTSAGYLLAVGLPGAAHGDWLGVALLGIALWVVCLNGGTLALNSAFDRDEGDIAYLRQPPPAPPHLAAFGLGLMLFGGAAAVVLLPRGFFIAYFLCVALSVLYSVPPIRLKAVPGVDWVINMCGFGTLTPYAGWAATGLPVGPAGRLVLFAFCPLFAALYPLTQIYQIEEDTRRGDRTLARVLGVRRSLVLSVGGVLTAFALFALASLKTGWAVYERWRWVVLALASLGWLLVLLPWLRQHRRMTPTEHQQGMYRALFAWALTDVAVVLAWAT
jgi:lycopene elongase/hydratase (dihydrobisanhydrobacterioruberin-forming)